MANEDAHDLKQARRRLSIMSENKLVEGFDAVNLDGDEEVTSTARKSLDKNEELEEENNSNFFIVNSYGGYSKKGYAPYNPQKKNQDSLIMAEDPNTRTLLFCVMDGHGEEGHIISQNIKLKFPSYLFSHRDFVLNIKNALTEVLERCESEILSDAAIDTDFSGTTFTCIIIRENKCYLCNIGDSRTTLGFRDKQTGEIKSRPLTIDHKPDLPLEKERIIKAGGRVFSVEYDDGVDGPPRVWLGHADIPGLAMSRSLGDAVAHTAGVSSEPEFFEYEFNKNSNEEDLVLVIASDGLWEFMSDDEVVKMVAETSEPRFAVDKLISEASARWMREENIIDDTTVCVAFLGDFQVKN